jgi:hypothetical protein
MADYEPPVFAWPQPDIEPCWMCGSHLPVTQLLADGGGACKNLRWYCLDVRVCTERWTTHERPDSGRAGEESPSARRAAGVWS